MWGRRRVINFSHLSICVRQRWKTALIVRFLHKLRPKYAPFSSFTYNTDWMHAVGYDDLYKYFYCIWEKKWNGSFVSYYISIISFCNNIFFFNRKLIYAKHKLHTFYSACFNHCHCKFFERAVWIPLWTAFACFPLALETIVWKNKRGLEENECINIFERYRGQQ